MRAVCACAIGFFLFDPAISHADASVSLFGIDGSYRHGNELIAIQNGIAPHRVVALALSQAVFFSAFPNSMAKSHGKLHG